MKKQDIDKIFASFARQNPAPKGELNYHNPYTLLVAVTLSAQSTDTGVNRATQSLFQQVAEPQDMLDLGEDALIEHIRSLGLFNSKARNIMAAARILVEAYGGRVPESREALEALPGVGRKTANVVLNIAFGQPTLAVDTHVFRVANRIGLASGKTPLAVEQALLECIPSDYLPHAHHWLILHGRYICKARNPACGECVIRPWCSFPDKSADADD